MLADANGLGGDDALVAGSTLTVPEVKTSLNDASTFKPYDPSEITGPTTPSLPYIPPPDQGCGAIGQIIMVIVTIVVTVYTAGAAATAMGAASGGVMSTGASVLAGATSLSTTTAMGIAAGSAFVGSVAGQAVGSATGVASFSWRSAASSGLAAGLTAGIGKLGLLGKVTEKMGAFGGSAFGQGMVSGVSSNLVRQATDRIAGVDTSFSWKSVAISAVAAGIGNTIADAVGSKLNLETESHQMIKDFVGGAAGGLVSHHLRRQIGLDKGANYGMVLADAFGTMLANRMTGQHARAAEAARPKPSDEQRADWERLLLEEGRLPTIRLSSPDDYRASTFPVSDPWFDSNYIPEIEELPNEITRAHEAYPGEVELAAYRGAYAANGVAYSIAEGLKGSVALARDFGGSWLYQQGLIDDPSYHNNLGQLTNGVIEWVTGEDPLGVIVESYKKQYALADELEARGQYKEAAFVRGQSNFEVLSTVAGVTSAANSGRRGAISLAARIEELGPGPTGRRAQIGAIGDLTDAGSGALDARGLDAPEFLGDSSHRLGMLPLDNALPNAARLLDEVPTSWRQHERLVLDELSSRLGENIAEKVYLKVELPDGRSYTVIPDGLERVGNSFVVHEAKFSQNRNLAALSGEELQRTFTRNQRLAFESISRGEARVTLLNSEGGRLLMGDEFRMGMELKINPRMNIYVNTPDGVVKRSWP